MNAVKGIYKKKPDYHFHVPHNNEETEAREIGSGDASQWSSPYLIAFSLGGRWLWLADPWLPGRKSRTLSVFTPRLGLSWMRAGLIRRSCMSHFMHTRWEKSAGSNVSTFVRACGSYLEHNHWAAGGEAAPSLLPAPAAMPSAPSRCRKQCFGPAAGQLLSQTWDSLVRREYIIIITLLRWFYGH